MKVLTSTRGWQYAYTKQLKDRIEGLREALEQSAIEDVPYIQGRIRGIRDCLDDLTDVRKRFNVDEDEDIDSE